MPSAYLINKVAVGRAHGNFKNSGTHYVSADAYEFQTGNIVYALLLIPVHPIDQDRRGQGEGFNIVNGGGGVPKPVCSGKRRLVARFPALALQGLQERTLLAANVSTRD